MRVLIDVTHPAHVHFFRHAIDELQARGHVVAVTTRQKDITIELLEELGIPYTVLSRAGHGLAGLLGEMLLRDLRLVGFCRRFRPDILTAISGAFAAQTGWLIRRPAVVWDDTEHQTFAHAVTYPFATAVHSPDCYRKSFGKKHFRYAGCHELAYLHPKRFTPDKDVVRSLGIDPDRPYCVVRFIGWGAHHDVGQHGIAAAAKADFIRRLAEHARPYITSETPLPDDLEQYRLRIPVAKVHHVLAFASLLVTEGATMASEAALLGTPSVYVNTLGAGTIDMFTAAGLVWHLPEADAALDRSLALLTDPAAQANAAQARRRLVADKLDVTAHIVTTLEQHAPPGRQA